MEKIESYWTWEEAPGVLVDYGDDNFGGFHLAQGSDEWEKQTEWDVVQWFKECKKLSKPSFEMKYGKIGDQLPQLPPA